MSGIRVYSDFYQDQKSQFSEIFVIQKSVKFLVVNFVGFSIHVCKNSLFVKWGFYSAGIWFGELTNEVLVLNRQLPERNSLIRTRERESKYGRNAAMDETPEWNELRYDTISNI